MIADIANRLMETKELAKLIREMGDTTRRYAAQFDETADLLEGTGDLSYVSEAVSTSINLINNLHLVRLVQRLSKLAGK